MGDRLEIICDGGVRRGGDIVKAIARGAARVHGRPRAPLRARRGRRAAAWTTRSAIIDRDVRRTMALVGARSVADITRDLVS